MCCDGLGSPSNMESPLSLPSRTIWQYHEKYIFFKSPIIKLSNKTKGQDFCGHMYKRDSQGISKQLFPYMQTLSDAIIFGVLYRVKLHNNNLAVRKHVKAPPWHRHTYWHKRWRPWLWNPRTSVKSTWNQAPDPPRACSQRIQRECLHKPCFHRKPGQTHPHLQKCSFPWRRLARPAAPAAAH